MAKAQSKQAAASLQKQWLRLLQFAQGRRLILKSEGPALWFEAQGVHEGKCRMTVDALQQGISVGLFVIGAGGLLVERPEAHAFRQRHAVDVTPQEASSYLQQHHRVEPVSLLQGESGQRRVAQRVLPSLALLERLKSADGTAYFARPLVEAGEMLAGDFHAAQLSPRVTMRWEPKLNSHAQGARNQAADISDHAAHARLRFNRALRAIGPELSGVVVDAVCFEKGLELIERERQWPARSAKLMLRTGLEILARHYQPQMPQKEHLRAWTQSNA